jgi:aminoglycoside phosphotransferase
VAVEGFGDYPELDDEIAGEVLRLLFTALLTPQAKQGRLVVTHDDAGV